MSYAPRLNDNGKPLLNDNGKPMLTDGGCCCDGDPCETANASATLTLALVGYDSYVDPVLMDTHNYFRVSALFGVTLPSGYRICTTSAEWFSYAHNGSAVSEGTISNLISRVGYDVEGGHEEHFETPEASECEACEHEDTTLPGYVVEEQTGPAKKFVLERVYDSAPYTAGRVTVTFAVIRESDCTVCETGAISRYFLERCPNAINSSGGRYFNTYTTEADLLNARYGAGGAGDYPATVAVKFTGNFYDVTVADLGGSGTCADPTGGDQCFGGVVNLASVLSGETTINVPLDSWGVAFTPSASYAYIGTIANAPKMSGHITCDGTADWGCTDPTTTVPIRALVDVDLTSCGAAVEMEVDVTWPAGCSDPPTGAPNFYCDYWIDEFTVPDNGPPEWSATTVSLAHDSAQTHDGVECDDPQYPHGPGVAPTAFQANGYMVDMKLNV